MPRNGSGTYALPVAPFVPNTAILSADVNDDFDDIAAALTGSVAADGQTALSGPILFTSGSLAAPGISFAADEDTGRYRVSANVMADVCAGTLVVTYTATGITVAGTLAAGALSVTSITMTGDAAVGGNLAVTGNETVGGTLGVTGILTGGDGTVALPQYSFISDPDSGLYRIGANNLGVAVNGAKVLDIATTGLSITGAFSASTSITAGNGLTVTTGAVSLPAASVANAALATPPGRTLLATLTASASASLSDTTSLTASYKNYEIVLENIILASAGVNLRLRLKVAGSVQTTGYLSTNFSSDQSNNSGAEGQTTYIGITGFSTITSGAPGVNGTLRICNPSTSAIHPVTGNVSYLKSAGVSCMAIVSGFYNTAGAVTGFELSATSNNLTSGNVYIYGLT